MSASRIILLMGVSGSGKTTIGRLLAEELGWEFHDADHLHPPANVDKMRRGIGLTDEDRDGWLDRVRRSMLRLLEDSVSAVVACSALKQRYRERLRVGPRVTFVHLHGDRELLESRLRSREGHFAGPELLDGQLRDLELPGDEILRVDVGETPRSITARIRRHLGP